MKKNDFLDKLTKELRDNQIDDIDDIIAEYEDHFSYKTADGYSEEEIAAKLGNPAMLAEQYLSTKETQKTTGKKLINIIGLIFADIFVFFVFIILYAWVFVMISLVVTSLTIGFCLAININIYNLLPTMPYWSAILFAIAFFALSILSVTGTIYCASYIRQLVRAYMRFHKNSINAASGKTGLPALATYPRYGKKVHRILRSITLVSLTLFIVSIISAYLISSLLANSLGFWHVWGWFVK